MLRITNTTYILFISLILSELSIMNIFLYDEQTTQDAVRHLPKIPILLAEKTTSSPMVVFSVFTLYVVYIFS